MINRAVYNLKLTRAELKQLAVIRPWEGKHWEKPPNPQIKAIKAKIRQQLEDVQKVCGYCGLKLGGTSGSEIEHIAPKAFYRNPEFTFTLKNLTLACNSCNSSKKKGTKQTIDKKHKIYFRCTFLIVHPYFDDPISHFEWTDNDIELLIQVRNNSPKGFKSIEMFGLDTPIMSELRAGQVRHEERKALRPLTDPDGQLLNDILNFKIK
jgi:uncharacterized protein (TIGR02646 family)